MRNLILLYKQWPPCVPRCHSWWQIDCFSASKFVCILYCWSVTSQREELTNRFIGELGWCWTVRQRHTSPSPGTHSSHCLFSYSTLSWTIKMSLANFSKRHAWALKVSHFPTEPILHLKSLVRHCGLCWLRLWGLCAVTQTKHRAGVYFNVAGLLYKKHPSARAICPLVRCFSCRLW